MSTGILAFSGDPITYGHIDIIERALKVFDHVVVGIGENPEKRYTFSLEERTSMAEISLSHLGNLISVVSFQGLLVDYAYSKGIPTIIRGIRNSSDADYERMLNDINSATKLHIDTVILFADQSLSHISSSAAKELQKHHGNNVIDYVPMYVKKKLEQKINDQYIIGITGEIGAGKSTISQLALNSLIDWTQECKIHLVNIDQVAHSLLESCTEPFAFAMRSSLVDLFASNNEEKDKIVLSNDQLFLNSKHLGSLIWADAEKRHVFNNTIMEPLLFQYRQEIMQKKGIILVESALMVDAKMTHVVNNDIILVTAKDDVRRERLLQRGYSVEEMDLRIKSQQNADWKREQIRLIIDHYKHGLLYEIDNTLSGIEARQTICRSLVDFIKLSTGKIFSC
jgi:pantetheine-phosphate adenylyltransferase